MLAGLLSDLCSATSANNFVAFLKRAQIDPKVQTGRNLVKREILVSTSAILTLFHQCSADTEYRL